MEELLELPDFELHDIYRALDVLDKESDFIQARIYEAAKAERNDAVLYYDCTNFFFEIEEEKGIRKYGKSKWIFRCAESANPDNWKSPVRNREITLT